MAEINTHAGNVRLIGGRLCLDFVNTVDCHTSARPKEYLVSYAALVAWGGHAGLLQNQAAAALLAEAARHPAEAAVALAVATRLRAALYRIFTGAAVPDDVAALNRVLADERRQARVAQTTSGFTWDWALDESRLDQLLWPIACSAAELLTSADLALVRECEGERCSWLFLDTSRNRTRRWCSMEDCGNRAKARRYYAQRKALSGFA
jgi:predicted RNA-binding Zn ribbon-like protein